MADALVANVIAEDFQVVAEVESIFRHVDLKINNYVLTLHSLVCILAQPVLLRNGGVVFPAKVVSPRYLNN